MQTSFKFKTSNYNKAKNITIQYIKEQAQDYESSTREYDTSKYCNTYTTRIMTKWAHKYYLLFKLKQVLIYIFAILSQSSMLFNEQEALLIKLVN